MKHYNLSYKKEKYFAADNIISYQNFLFNKQVFLYLLQINTEFCYLFYQIGLEHETLSYTSLHIVSTFPAALNIGVTYLRVT